MTISGASSGISERPDDHAEELAELKARIEPTRKTDQYDETAFPKLCYIQGVSGSVLRLREKRFVSARRTLRLSTLLKKPTSILPSISSLIASRVKPPKQSDLQAKSTKLKEKYNALVPGGLMLSSEERRRHRSIADKSATISKASISRSVTGGIRRRNALSRKRKTIWNNERKYNYEQNWLYPCIYGTSGDSPSAGR